MFVLAVFTLVVLQDGRLASGSEDGTIRVWNITDNPQETSVVLGGHTGPVLNMCVFGVDSLLASASADHSVRVWSCQHLSCLFVLNGHTNAVRCLAALGPSNIISSGSEDNTIRIWNCSSDAAGVCTRILMGHSSWVTTLKTLHNTWLASGSVDGNVRLWDTQNNTSIILSGHTGAVWSIAVNYSTQLFILVFCLF